MDKKTREETIEIINAHKDNIRQLYYGCGFMGFLAFPNENKKATFYGGVVMFIVPLENKKWKIVSGSISKYLTSKELIEVCDKYDLSYNNERFNDEWVRKNYLMEMLELEKTVDDKDLEDSIFKFVQIAYKMARKRRIRNIMLERAYDILHKGERF